MDRNATIAVTAAIWAIGLFVLVRVIVPGLMNMQNDGALLAAPLIVIVYVSAAYATWRKLFWEKAE